LTVVETTPPPLEDDPVLEGEAVPLDELEGVPELVGG